MDNQNATELEKAYRLVADCIRAVMLAGGPARCNGEWGRYVDAKNLVKFLEDKLVYECDDKNKTTGI